MMLLLLYTIAVASALPVNDNADRDLPRLAMQNPDLFGGDMLESLEDILDRNALPEERFRWPNAVVPYEIDSSLSQVLDYIQKGFDDYHRKTCVRFVPRTNQQDYIRLFAGQGCYAHVGRIGGRQLVSLGDGCIYVGTVVHELCHSLGFWHEQNRSDRDDYLEIFLENVVQNQQYNFNKFLPQQLLLLTPFDYDSIMIYGNEAFSKNGRWTMKAKNGQKLLDPFNKPNGLDESDAKRVNIMYKCK